MGAVNGYVADYRDLCRHVRTLFRQYKAERSVAFWRSIFEAFE